MQAPKYVYKYHSFNVHLIELLVNGQLYLADRDQLNDPLDSNFTMNFEDYLNIYYEKYPIERTEEHEKSLKHIFEWQRDQGDTKFLNELSDLPEGLKITCFTEEGNNPLMWSHYASNHNGVCLKFDSEKDKKLLAALKPVKYVDQLVEVKHKSDFEKSLLTKLNQWSIEKEWRILEKENYFPFKHKSLIEIVLGLKVSESAFSWFKQLCENVYYSDTAIHKMVIRANRLVKINYSGDIVADNFIPVPRKPYPWEAEFENLQL